MDITGKIGTLNGETVNPAPEYPMYSYERPAWMVWGAVADEMQKRGWKEEQILEWLQSKNARWALDGELGNMIAGAVAKWAELNLPNLGKPI